MRVFWTSSFFYSLLLSILFGLVHGQYTFQEEAILPKLSFDRSAVSISEGPARWGWLGPKELIHCE